MKKPFVILFTILSFQLFGQATDSLAKPKIGLVLSGGGAKGLAHIGVLKVLEKYGIRPAVIGGTSMGAIVGSLYASGYSARQIDSIFHTMDFDAILYNQYDRKYQHYYKKEHGEKYVLGIPFSLKKMSVQLPSGLSDSQKMFNVLAENLQPVSNIDDFSQLKIPFICMATDIASGEQVLFNKGYLPEAVTASALLPSIYSPLDINEHLLLDGGIVNNYPVKEIRDFGTNFIIGSDVQGKILSKKEITDLPSIMDQIVSFGMYKEMPYKITMTDLYIKPDISGIGLTDFEKIDTIIKRGETATEKLLKERGIINSLASDYQAKDLHYQKPDSLSFDQIVLQGQKMFKRDYILGKIAIRPYQKISYHDFIDGINNLIGTGNFEKVHYRFLHQKDKNLLIINLKERQHKASINLGFHFNDLYKMNVIGNFKNKRLLTNNDMLSIDLIGGNYFRYNFDYIIDNGFKLTWGIHSSLHQFTHRVSAGELFGDENFGINKLDFNYLQLSNKVYFQGNLNHFIYLRIGMQHRHKRLYTYVFSTDETETYDFGNRDYYGNYASINFDNRNDYDFPTKGWYLKLKWNYTWTASDIDSGFQPFSLYSLDMNYTKELFKHWQLQPEIKAGLHYSKKHYYENIFYIGGNNHYKNFDNLINFAPLNVLSVKATKFVSFSLTNQWHFYKNHFISAGGHFLFFDQTDDLLPETLQKIYGYNIGYGFKSFLGPLRLNWGRVPQWERNYLAISFGYTF